MYKIIQIDFQLFVQEKQVYHNTLTCSLRKFDEKNSYGCKGKNIYIQIS
jgi:hypothetical protein